MKQPSIEINRVISHMLAVAFCVALFLPTAVFGQGGQNAVGSHVSPAATPNAVVVKTVTVNLKDGLITIVGTNFGTAAPTLMLDSTQLVTVSGSFGPGPDPGTQQIMAYLPANFLPPSLKAGTHLLTVSIGGGTNQATEFDTAFVVSSFNGRPGDVTLTSTDVTSVLTAGTGISITPAGVISLPNTSVTVNAGAGLSGGGNVALGGSTTLTNAGVLSFNSRSGNVTLGSGDITNALGAAPLTSVTTNATLTGNGTSASPLGLASPITVSIDSSNNTVQVGNTVTSPAMVRDVDNPARQPFDGNLFFNLSDGVGAVSGSLDPVPAGKILVIEFVSAEVTLPPGQNPRVSIRNTFGRQQLHFLAVTAQVPFNTFSGSSTIFTINQPTRIYIRAGDFVVMGIQRDSSTGLGSMNITISGYLVNAP